MVVACTLPSQAMAADEDSKAIPLKAINHPGIVDFQSEILPLLRDNCLACHNSTRAKADLILETPSDILHGGENGPAAVPGNGKGSLLVQAAAHRAEPFMPPKDNKVKAIDLTGEQLSLISLWIDQGAKGEVKADAPIKWVAPAADVRPIYAVALTPDGRFAAAGRANHLDVYDLPLGELSESLVDPGLARFGMYGKAGAAHRGLIESLAFSPDGSRLASGAFGEVKIWRREAPAVQFALSGPPSHADAPIAAVGAGGNWVAIARSGLPIDLFDAMTGKWAKSIDASTSRTRAIAFSPDAMLLAIASADGSVRISTIAEGQLVAETATPAAVNALAWIAHGSQLATAGTDGVIRIYTIPPRRGDAWTVARELKGHSGPVTTLAASARGDQIYSAGEDGIIRCWNTNSGQLLRQLAQNGPVTALDIRADGKILASMGSTGRVRLWNAEQGTVIAELGGNIEGRRELADRDRAEKLASADVGYLTSVLEKSQAAKKATDDRLKAATEAKAAADAKANEAQSARDRAVAAKQDLEKPPATMPTTAPADPKMKQKIEEAARALAQAETQLAAVSLARNNADTEFRLATAAVATAAKDVEAAGKSLSAAQDRLKAARDALAAAKQDAAERPVSHLAFSPDGSTLACGAQDGTIDLYAAESGIPMETIRAPHGPPAAMGFAGRKLAIATQTQVFVLTLGGTWSLERTIGTGDAASELQDRVTSVAFSPDGRLLATGAGEPSRSGQIKLWDADTGQFVREIKDAHSDTVLALEFSPDGKLLASGSSDRFAKVFDVESGKLVKTFEGHTDHVTGVSWRADGRALATSGADNQVKFWDIPSGERKANGAGFGKEVDAVCYVGLSDQAVAAGGDGQIRILNEAGAVVKTLPSASDFFHAAAVTPDGGILAVGGESGTLFVWREPFKASPLGFAATGSNPSH